MDDDFLEIIQKKPRFFFVLMMRFASDQVVQKMREKEEVTLADVDAAALAAHASKVQVLGSWAEGGPSKSRTNLGSVPLLDDELHVFKQEWRHQQEKRAKEVVEWFKKKRMQMEFHTSASAWKIDVADMLKRIEDTHMLKRDEIHVIMLYDLNTPTLVARHG